MRGRRIVVAVVGALVVAGSIGYVVGSAADQPVSRGERTGLPGFSQGGVPVAHQQSGARARVPGRSFVHDVDDLHGAPGRVLSAVREGGEHTGTHYSAPCHFHVASRCADQLDPGDFVLPAVVVDVRAKVSKNVDYEVSVADLKAWEPSHGQIPPRSAVLLWTGCDRWWGPAIGADVRTYYNCGTGKGSSGNRASRRRRCGGYHRRARTARGARTDTFGPDPGTDPLFLETWLTLRNTPLHAGEPHEPGCDAIARRVDRDRRTEEPARFRGAEHDLRLGSLRGTHRSARGPTKGRGQAGSALGQGAPLARPVRVEQSRDRGDGEVAGGSVADPLDRHRERHRPLGVGPR